MFFLHTLVVPLRNKNNQGKGSKDDESREIRDRKYINAVEVIAVSGNTGMSIGFHIYLTTRKDGKAFNPTILLDIIRSIKN